jgi:hypothetical protein
MYRNASFTLHVFLLAVWECDDFDDRKVLRHKTDESLWLLERSCTGDLEQCRKSFCCSVCAPCSWHGNVASLRAARRVCESGWPRSALIFRARRTEVCAGKKSLSFVVFLFSLRFLCIKFVKLMNNGSPSLRYRVSSPKTDWLISMKFYIASVFLNWFDVFVIGRAVITAEEQFLITKFFCFSWEVAFLWIRNCTPRSANYLLCFIRRA